MIKNRIAVVGVYGHGPEFTTGQAVKCIELIDWFSNKYGNQEVYVANTYRWKSNPLKLCRLLLHAFAHSRNIILMPAQNGLKVFAPISFCLAKVFHNSVHYVVIGGWLAEALQHHATIRRCVASFDGVYVETHSMVKKLRALGLGNVKYMPNYRKLTGTVSSSDSMTIAERPIHVCTYSRVIEEKGILDAIDIVKKANQIIGYPLFYLDIYGKVSEDFQNKLGNALAQDQSVVSYRGIRNADEGVATLSQYFALLFPTYYRGEGFAGTLLDSFAAHTPVIVNDWKYNSEIVVNGKNGFIYPFRNTTVAAEQLCKLYQDRALYELLRKGCKQSAEEYSTNKVLGDFDRLLK